MILCQILGAQRVKTLTVLQSVVLWWTYRPPETLRTQLELQVRVMMLHLCYQQMTLMYHIWSINMHTIIHTLRVCTVSAYERSLNYSDCIQEKWWSHFLSAFHGYLCPFSRIWRSTFRILIHVETFFPTSIRSTFLCLVTEPHREDENKLSDPLLWQYTCM